MYIYNLDAQTDAVEADVNFSTNGLLTAGITHAPGTSQIVVTSPGDYEVTFSVLGVGSNQYALFLNGAPVVGTVYGSGAGTQQDNGQAIIAIAAGDVLSLRNHTSDAALDRTFNLSISQSRSASSIICRFSRTVALIARIISIVHCSSCLAFSLSK